MRRLLLTGATEAGLLDEVSFKVVRSPDFFDSFVFQFWQTVFVDKHFFVYE